jgi:hypothetical protein
MIADATARGGQCRSDGDRPDSAAITASQLRRATRKSLFVLLLLLLASLAAAQSGGAASPGPAWLTGNFDYAAFTRFDAPAPPRPLIYQSNGYLALQEQGFGAQRMIVPVAGPAAPTNGSERLVVLEIEAPIFTNSSGRSFDFLSSPARRSMT